MTEKALGTTTASVAVASTASALIATSVSSGSTAAAWMMINQYQLLLSVPTLETNMPEELLEFMEEFQFATGRPTFLENWSFGQIDVAVDSIDFPQEVIGLSEIGYESGSIIVNEYNFGKFLFTVLSINIILVILYFSLYKFREKKLVKKVTEKASEFFSFTIYIRVTLEIYYFLFIIAFSEMIVNAGNIQEGLSYAAAVITVVLSFALPAIMLWHYIKYHKTEGFGEEGKCTELYDGFKTKKLCKLYFFIFC